MPINRGLTLLIFRGMAARLATVLYQARTQQKRKTEQREKDEHNKKEPETGIDRRE